MNTTKARCGHEVTAVGAPGSSARKAVESGTCRLPRCRSGLPAKFTDRECAAYTWIVDRDIRGWLVDLLTKRVTNGEKSWANLIEFAQHHGWEG